MSRILITTSSFGKLDPTPLELLQDNGLDIVLNPYGRKLTEDEVFGLLEEHRPIGMVAGVEPLTRKVLEQAEGLKVISRCGIGMDSVDLDAAAEMGIAVTNTPDAPTMPVAELTLGLILGLLRQLHISDASIRSGGWERPMGNLLYGKTVGVIGCGRIGRWLGRLLQPFECTLLGYDPYQTTSDMFQLIALDELLANADIMSLHLPYTEENHHLIGGEQLQQMKQSAILINASRGGLVDEDALCKVLKLGLLAGAALDCFEQEPYVGDLAQLDNVLLTGHIGSYAEEGRAIMEQQAAENLISCLGLEEGE